MSKKRLVYIWSLRNAACDLAGQLVEYKGAKRYMTSPLKHLAELLNNGPLGEAISLEQVIFDDDPGHAPDRAKLAEYGFSSENAKQWFYPPQLSVQGRRIDDLLVSIPSTYRRLSATDAARAAGKRDFEQRLLTALEKVRADIVVLDGLLVILDDLVRPGAPFSRRIFNIHPGITHEDSPYQRRGAYATLDALYGARGEKVVNWQTMEKTAVPVLAKTGASFHFVDNGIDSGEVVADVLATDIDAQDTILELRWKNFHHSLFPALQKGLASVAGVDLEVTHAA